MLSIRESISLVYGLVIEEMDVKDFIADALGYDFINKLCMEVGATAREVEQMKDSCDLCEFFGCFKSFLKENNVFIDYYDGDEPSMIIYAVLNTENGLSGLENDIKFYKDTNNFETLRKLAKKLDKELELILVEDE